MAMDKNRFDHPRWLVRLELGLRPRYFRVPGQSPRQWRFPRGVCVVDQSMQAALELAMRMMGRTGEKLWS